MAKPYYPVDFKIVKSFQVKFQRIFSIQFITILNSTGSYLYSLNLILSFFKHKKNSKSIREAMARTKSTPVSKTGASKLEAIRAQKRSKDKKKEIDTSTSTSTTELKKKKHIKRLTPARFRRAVKRAQKDCSSIIGRTAARRLVQGILQHHGFLCGIGKQTIKLLTTPIDEILRKVVELARSMTSLDGKLHRISNTALVYAFKNAVEVRDDPSVFHVFRTYVQTRATPGTKEILNNIITPSRFVKKDEEGNEVSVFEPFAELTKAETQQLSIEKAEKEEKRAAKQEARDAELRAKKVEMEAVEAAKKQAKKEAKKQKEKEKQKALKKKAKEAKKEKKEKNKKKKEKKVEKEEKEPAEDSEMSDVEESEAENSEGEPEAESSDEE